MHADLVPLAELVAAGRTTSHAGHALALDDAAALAQVASGHTRGRVVVAVAAV